MKQSAHPEIFDVGYNLHKYDIWYLMVDGQGQGYVMLLFGYIIVLNPSLCVWLRRLVSECVNDVKNNQWWIIIFASFRIEI